MSQISMTHSPSNPLQEFSEAWGSIYPILHWSLDHPLGSFFLIFGGLYLFWGLLRGLIRLTENLWIRILRSPLWLARSLWQLTMGEKSPPWTRPQQKETGSINQRYQILHDLIQQLETGHQNQAQLLNRAKAELKKMESVNK